MTPSSTSGSEDFIEILTFKYFHQQKHRTYICNYELYIISLHTSLVSLQLALDSARFEFTLKMRLNRI